MKSNRSRFAGVVTLSALIVAGDALAQGGGPVDIYSQESQQRMPAMTVFPQYPEDARRDRLEGEATVCFRIDAHGQVVRPKVRRSTHRAFESPAMKAIRESTFRPLAASEPNLSSEVCRVYRFKLNPILESRAATLPETPLNVALANVTATKPNAEPLPPGEPRRPATSGAGADATAAGERTEVVVVSGETTRVAEDDTPVCKVRRRPGSLIATTVCYTRREQLALQRNKEETIDDLEQEGRWRDQVIQDAQMENRYPRGAGLGPSH